MPICIRTREEWSYGCTLWKQRHKWHMMRERSSRVMRVNTAECRAYADRPKHS